MDPKIVEMNLEFMSFIAERETEDNWYLPQRLRDILRVDGIAKNVNPESLPFDVSWEWLMLVVEKLSRAGALVDMHDLTDIDYITTVYWRTVDIYDYYKKNGN